MKYVDALGNEVIIGDGAWFTPDLDLPCVTLSLEEYVHCHECRLHGACGELAFEVEE